MVNGGKKLEENHWKKNFLWGGSIQESSSFVLDMVVNGGEQDKLRKIIDKKTTLGWFSLMITRLCFGYGGDWW